MTDQTMDIFIKALQKKKSEGKSFRRIDKEFVNTPAFIEIYKIFGNEVFEKTKMTDDEIIEFMKMNYKDYISYVVSRSIILENIIDKENEKYIVDYVLHSENGLELYNSSRALKDLMLNFFFQKNIELIKSSISLEKKN